MTDATVQTVLTELAALQWSTSATLAAIGIHHEDLRARRSRSAGVSTC
jgi:hypothetical protein